MLNLDMLDVAIGMVFVFLMLSLICSAVGELIEAVLKTRAEDLERGIGELLEKQGAAHYQDIVRAIYNHPLISSLYKGKDYDEAKKGNNLPSYIPSRNFALALMDIITPVNAEDSKQRVLKEPAKEIQYPTTMSKIGIKLKQLLPQKETQSSESGSSDQQKQNADNAVTKSGSPPNLKGELGQADAAKNEEATVNQENGGNQNKESPAGDANLPAVGDKVDASLTVSGSSGQPTQDKNNAGNEPPQNNNNADNKSAPPNLEEKQKLAGDAGLPAAADKVDASSTFKGYSLASVKKTVGEIDNPKIKGALLPLFDAAENDVDRLRANIEDWFNGTMDRVSGWYKRRAQWRSIVLGIIVAVGVNADTIAIFKSLTRDPAARASLVSASQEYAKAEASAPKDVPKDKASTPKDDSKSETSAPAGDPKDKASTPKDDPKGETPTPKRTPTKLDENLDKIKSLGLPIGWNCRSIPSTPSFIPCKSEDTESGMVIFFAWLIKVFGWLITAMAISLGAPFWFDVLNKFMVVRSTVKPKEKSKDEGQKDAKK